MIVGAKFLTVEGSYKYEKRKLEWTQKYYTGAGVIGGIDKYRKEETKEGGRDTDVNVYVCVYLSFERVQEQKHLSTHLKHKSKFLNKKKIKIKERSLEKWFISWLVQGNTKWVWNIYLIMPESNELLTEL